MDTTDTTADTTDGGGCGNDMVDPGEECDGTDLDSQDCMSQGFDAGRLACANDCTFDVSGCMDVPGCGNDAIDGMETCDGTDLGGEDCV
ncbi:MAG: hypothetical protein KDA28_06370, partial [Phycisphaerales bacterium]|nr:hypothetical protein [Phycisphaerales bacterium]